VFVERELIRGHLVQFSFSLVLLITDRVLLYEIYYIPVGLLKVNRLNPATPGRVIGSRLIDSNPYKNAILLFRVKL